MYTLEEYLREYEILKNAFLKRLNRHVQRSRKLTEAHFLLVLTDMSQNESYASSLAKHNIDVTKGGFSTFRDKIPASDFEDFFKVCSNLAIKAGVMSENRLYAVDGSKLTLLNTFKKDGYETTTSPNFVSALLGGIIDTETYIPVTTDVFKTTNERGVFKSQLDRFKPGDAFVMDAGYYSFDLANDMISRQFDVIFKMTTGVGAVKKFAASENNDVDAIIYDAKKKASISLRLVKYVINEKTTYLGTTFTDRTQYPLERLKNMYHARWNIEEHFKLLKRSGGIEWIHSRKDNGMKQEIIWALILIQHVRIIEALTQNLLNKPKE